MLTMRSLTTTLVAISALALATSAEAQPMMPPTDLVYTPVRPCRVLDTRAVGTDGYVRARRTRSFVAAQPFDFATQGGEPGDCNLSSAHAWAVALTLTVVAPASAGYATVYPFGGTQPMTASLTYEADAVVTSTIITAVAGASEWADLTLFSFADAHYVADIIGYFRPPYESRLECEETMPTSAVILPGQTGTVAASACPLGHWGTGTNCATDGNMPLLSNRNGVCQAINDGASAGTLSASFTCCRVPGR